MCPKNTNKAQTKLIIITGIQYSLLFSITHKWTGMSPTLSYTLSYLNFNSSKFTPIYHFQLLQHHSAPPPHRPWAYDDTRMNITLTTEKLSNDNEPPENYNLSAWPLRLHRCKIFIRPSAYDKVLTLQLLQIITDHRPPEDDEHKTQHIWY